jgi:aspartate aminotransferase-like enzyme
MQSPFLKSFAKKANKSKFIFTPGPSSLSWQNIATLSPAFGRNDDMYLNIEMQVMSWLKNLSGQNEIVRMQGSSTTGIEVALENFVSGKVLILNSGFYSNRMYNMLKQRRDIQATNLVFADFLQVYQDYDWIIAAPTETSTGFLTPIETLHQISTRCKAKLFLDATASIGLEQGHNLADVVCFSSCKGLFGLTGAAFIAYSVNKVNDPSSFTLNLETYLDKKTTGPYHSIQSLFLIIDSHSRMVKSVVKNKERMLEICNNLLVHMPENQPKLCTALNSTITPLNKKVILYQPRIKNSFSIICHLGEVHLGDKAKGKIIDEIKIDALTR